MGKRILLVTPPYHAGVVESAGRWPHLGFVYVAGALKSAGYEVEILDVMARFLGLEDVARRVEDWKPDVVCSTAYTSSVNAALDVLQTAKGVDPSIATAIGGVHPTFCYDEILREHADAVDFVVRGEGEVTMRELADALDASWDRGRSFDFATLNKVRGIAYSQDGEVVATPPRPFVHRLDDLRPAWDLLDWNDYYLYYMKGSRVAAVSSSRGCINECGFCSQQKFWQKTYRMRSADNFVAELEHLYTAYGANVFLVTDEYPTLSRERWERILDLLIERRMPIHLMIETCVGDILRDAEIMWKYREAGILHLYVGVEGTRQERLDRFKKSVKCDESRESIRLISEAGIISECSFIIGLPEDTTESIQDTLELAKHYGADFSHFLLIAPWPYADMYDELKPYIEEYDYSKYNLVEPVVKPIAMTREELFQQVLKCYRDYYTAKLPQWYAMESGIKRQCLLEGMKSILDRSFLKKFGHGLGKMPEEVEKYLSLLRSE